MTPPLKSLKNLHFDCFWSKYVKFELRKCRGVMFDGHWRLMQNVKETDLCFLKWHEEFDIFWFTWLKIAISFLESKMAELNQNKNTKQPDRPDAARKLYFTLEINE